MKFYPDWILYSEGPDGEINMETGTDLVGMPLFFWKKISRYIIDAEAALDIYEANK